MSKTVVGLFSTMAQAQEVKSALVSNGYEAHNINVVANDESDTSSSSMGTAGSGIGSTSASAGSAYGSSSPASTGAAGVGEKIGSFFRNLTGGDEDTHKQYASGVSSGGALLAVTVADDQAYEVATLLKQHGARDLEGGYQSAASSGTPVYSGSSAQTSGTAATAVSGETAIPIIEEQLVVGKREVDRGGVRIYSHVTERPVEASVTLHEERVNVERRAVDRPATAADFQAGEGSVIELNAMGEEAVVGKSSRVVEEVLVGKQGSDRVEQVHDTVRKTEVEVENIEATTTASSSAASGSSIAGGSSAVPTKNNY